MKLISVSSLTYYVTDIAKTKAFYEAVGFHFDAKTDKVITYLNWFSIELRPADGPLSINSGERVNIKVDSVKELVERLTSAGYTTESLPQAVGGGVTEVVVKDPDGYQLTFFEKK